MPIVVGVEFRPVHKIYHFSSNGLLDLMANDYVVVNTSRGQTVAKIVQPPHEITEEEVNGEIQNVLRRATAWDLVSKDRWEHKSQEALALCREKARELELDMKIVRCEYNYTGGRLTIYYSSNERVHHRNLARSLSTMVHARIEMIQIGVRDEAKMLDGVGKCGRQLCCTSWLREFTPVSIRMAKSQQLPLNPDEISGVCGRLLCCLSYEDATYREQNKKMPKVGATVTTPQGNGRVRHVHPLKETVTVYLETRAFAEFSVSELITNKPENGDGCGTCGGCTVKRRASAAEDNERTRKAARRKKG